MLNRLLEHASPSQGAGVYLGLLEKSERWRALAGQRGLRDVVDAILAYAQSGLGAQEAAVLRVETTTGELAGTWMLPGRVGSSLCQVRWSVGGIGGAVGRCLHAAEPVAGDADHEPLLTINGDRPEPRTDHGRFLVVPVLSALPHSSCFDGGWLHRQGCPSFESIDPEGIDVRSPLHPCASCENYPVRGALVLTDLENTGPWPPDQTHAVALGQVISSVFERAALRQRVDVVERFRLQALDAMYNGVVTTDRKGKVVFANQRAGDMTGRERGGLTGQSFETLFELPDAPDALRHALSYGRSAVHLEGFLRRPAQQEDVARVPIRLNLAPFRLEEGGHFGAVCVFEDRSSIRAMEEEIRHLDTLAAIGRFASSLAHEIRNPLGGISAGVNYLLRTSELDEEQRQHMGVIQGEIERVDEILRDLLAVARTKELDLTAVDTAELLEGTARSLEHWAAEQDVTLEVSCEFGVAPVHLDRDMLLQVMMNLVKNAVEASEAGGLVELLLRACRPHDLVTDAATGRRGGVVLSVLDAGPGVPEADQSRLFEPFFSRKVGGTGLGLYICHNFVCRHSGQIRVARSPRGGASFEVILPTYPACMGASQRDDS